MITNKPFIIDDSVEFWKNSGVLEELRKSKFVPLKLKKSNMTKILSFQNPKGGVSQSTLTMLFATYLVAEGKSVLIMDTDLINSTCFSSYKETKKTEDFKYSHLLEVISIEYQHIPAVLRSYKGKYDYILIDVYRDEIGKSEIIDSQFMPYLVGSIVPFRINNFYDLENISVPKFKLLYTHISRETFEDISNETKGVGTISENSMNNYLPILDNNTLSKIFHFDLDFSTEGNLKLKLLCKEILEFII